MADLDYLDLLGDDPSAYANQAEMPAVELALINVAAKFIVEVRKNIENAKKVSTGALLDGISAGNVNLEAGGRYSVSMGYDENDPAAKYYDFVNKGVSGIVRGIPGSPYRFKKPLPSTGMVNNILKWIDANQRVVDLSQNVNLARSKGGVSGGTIKQAKAMQRKRKKLSQIEVKRSIAYAMAVSIKRKGINRTHFFDKAVTDILGQEFINELSKAAGADVQLKIRYGWQSQ